MNGINDSPEIAIVCSDKGLNWWGLQNPEKPCEQLQLLRNIIVRIYTKIIAIIAYHCYICMGGGGGGIRLTNAGITFVTILPAQPPPQATTV